MEKRKRRASSVVVTKRSAAPRVRHFKADSDPIRRALAISRYIALSIAPSSGGAGVDRGSMGGEGGPAQAAILLPDTTRQEGASFETEELEGFRGGNQPINGDRVC